MNRPQRAAILLSLVWAMFAWAQSPAPAGEVRVLFIGNSLTYVNNLPAMVEAFFKARHQPVSVDQQVAGGATLMDHVRNPEVAKKIAGRPWTFVVLQDQSALPARAPEMTLEAGQKLAALAREAGATPVFYVTWGYGLAGPGGMDADMQAALSRGYQRVAEASRARLAPVGPAWQAALAKDPQLKLHADDHIHPAPEGTYLAACVLYAVMSGQSPLGLPDSLSTTVGNRRQTLVRVPAGRARFYQQVAGTTAAERSVPVVTPAPGRLLPRPVGAMP